MPPAAARQPPTTVRCTAVAAVLLLAVSGCGAPDAAQDKPSSLAMSATPAAPGASVTSTPASVAAESPTLCGAPRPAQLGPFPFSKDAARRDSLVGVGLSPDGSRYLGDIAWFDELDAQGLAALIEGRFIDPYDRQNASPTVWQIFRFLCGHPQVRAAGYVVSLDRPDYRTSIETIYAANIDAALRADAQTFCVDAETVFEEHLECFWD